MSAIFLVRFQLLASRLGHRKGLGRGHPASTIAVVSVGAIPLARRLDNSEARKRATEIKEADSHHRGSRFRATLTTVQQALCTRRVRP
jgi:hypothetical protein